MCLLSVFFFVGLKNHLVQHHDNQTFEDNIRIAEDFWFFFSPEKQQFTGRPVAELAKFLPYLIWGNDPALFHLLVVGLHTLAAILLAWVAWRMGTDLRISLVGGLLFLVNVAHFQAVHHISALDYPLALIFGLGSLLFFVDYLSAPKWHRLWGFYFGSVVGLMAHLSVVMVWPFCLYWAWSRGYDLKTALRFLLPLLGILAAELAFIVFFSAKETSTSHAIGFYSEKDLLPFLSGMGTLLMWLLSRLVTTAHWLLVPIYEWNSWEFLVGFGTLAFLALLIWRNRFPSAVWSVWILLFAIPFLPLTDAMVRDKPWFFSRYLYLATAGSSMLLACVIEKAMLRARSWGSCLYPAMLAVILTSSYYFLKQSEAISIYSSGRHYFAMGDTKTGIEQLTGAIRQGPRTIDLHDAYLRLCLVSMAHGEVNSSLEKALTVFPDSFLLNVYKLIIDSLNPDSPTATSAWESLKVFKTFPFKIELKGTESDGRIRFGNSDGGNVKFMIASAYHNVALGFHTRKDIQTAISAYRFALEFNPSREKTWDILFVALVNPGLSGEEILTGLQVVETFPQAPKGFRLKLSFFLVDSRLPEQAITICSDVLEQGPTSAQSDSVYMLYKRILKDRSYPVSSSGCEKMALDLWNGGRRDDSISAFRLALEKERTNPRSHFFLGLALLANGHVEEAGRIYAQGVANFGRAGAEETGALAGIRNLIAKGIQVEAAREILATHWPGLKP